MLNNVLKRIMTCACRTPRALMPALSLAIFACDSGSAPPPPPTVIAAASANPNNNLSAIVHATVTQADSVRVVPVSAASSLHPTPFSVAGSGDVQIPVLGLRAKTTYSFAAEAKGPGGTVRSQPIEFTTGDLPAAIQSVRITTTQGARTSGYLYTSVQVAHDAYALAFDSTGQIVWYREFPGSIQGLAFQQQPNGNFTLFLGESQGWQATTNDYFVEFTPLGDEVRRWAAPQPFFTDGHELLLTQSSPGAPPVAHFFTYSIRNMDVTSLDGPEDAPIAQHAIHRITAGGAAELVWDSWNHFSLPDWIEPPRFPPLDIDHPNSLEVLSDGSYLVSWRNTGEITKISPTGSIIWRLGGAHNQFTISGDRLNGFSAQHFARMTPQGTLLLYDNGSRHVPTESRAVEYRLDESAKTATMVKEFRHSPAIFTPFVGSAQRLSNGNTLVGWGMALVATEFNSSGSTVWEGTLDLPATASPIFYRILLSNSLYGRG